MATTTSSTTAFTDSSLNDGTTYYYVVRAFDGTGESGDSNEDSAVPVDDPLLASTGLTAADRPGDQGGDIDITWTPSKSLDATGQSLYRGTSSGSHPTLVQTFNEDSAAPVNDIRIALPGVGVWGLIGLVGLIAAALMSQSRRTRTRWALRSSAP